MAITCKICGTVEEELFVEAVQRVMEKEELCFTCNFWREQMELDKKSPNDYVIVDNVHYRIGPDGYNGFRGYGGHKFKIKFNDGRERVTTNLWCQGDIPDGYWRELMPDNAIFIY